MAMLGKIDDLAGCVHPDGPLQQALSLLRDYQLGRRPEIAEIVARQKPGETVKIPISGDLVYLLVQCYETKAREQGRFEAHQAYTDVQFLGQGTEWIELFDLRQRGAVPTYDTSNNEYFPLDPEPCSRLLLKAGDVAVLFPNDAHAAGLRVTEPHPSLVHKLVIKVKNAHLVAG
jgi:biofilm protein TabA